MLTDPNFIHRHEQVDLGNGLQATRQTDPAMEIAELPDLDLVLVSHFHGDHFDQVAQRELDRELPIVTTPEATEELAGIGFRTLHGLDTWSSFTASNGASRLSITATPGRHGPPVVSFALPEVMGSLLEFQAAPGQQRLQDLRNGRHPDDRRPARDPRRYPEIDLALLHLGGTRVLGILLTMDGQQGVGAMRTVDPKQAIPIHYDDYDVFKSPLSDFQERVQEAGFEDRVHYLGRSGTYTFRLGDGGGQLSDLSRLRLVARQALACPPHRCPSHGGRYRQPTRCQFSGRPRPASGLRAS